MTLQAEQADNFHRLHQRGAPLILFNAWDAGSAIAIGRSGAEAIATGSWSVAAAHGVSDGEALTLAEVLANASRIARAVDLPVTIDFEAGYGRTPSEVGDAISQLIQTGVVGANIEDRFIDRPGLRPVDEQFARLEAARDAAERASIPFFINARTDVFLNTSADLHSEALVSEALSRAHAYAEAGASGLFVPGLVNDTLLALVCRESPLPVNVMMISAAPSVSRLAEIGVARISHGPAPYRAMQKWLEAAAKDALAH